MSQRGPSEPCSDIQKGNEKEEVGQDEVHPKSVRQSVDNSNAPSKIITHWSGIIRLVRNGVKIYNPKFHLNSLRNEGELSI